MPGKRKPKEAGGTEESEAFNPPPIVLPVSKAAPEDVDDPLQRFANWSLLVPTGLERKVWAMLGGERNPWRFKPQQVVGPYICDFLSRKVMVCIEADGPEHLKTLEADQKRDAYFLKQGIMTLRLTPADFVRYSSQKLYAAVEELSHVRHAVKVNPSKGKK